MKAKRKTKRDTCQCGSERFLIQPRWFNKFKRATWVCAAKSCPFRGKHSFRAMREPVVVGSVYVWRHDNEPVQVIGRSEPYWRVKGPRKTDVPYNFAYDYDLMRAAYSQLQWFAREKHLETLNATQRNLEITGYARR